MWSTNTTYYNNQYYDINPNIRIIYISYQRINLINKLINFDCYYQF